MLILGIETATEQVSVAIGGHEGVISTFEVARGRRHAEILVPAIEFMCRQADIELCELGCIAVDVGPGLFTGMRVGLASGKALAQALRIPMIGISSLDLLAFPHRHTDRVVVPVIDARKGEVFWAMYRQVPGGVQQVAAPTVGPVDELVADLLARSQEVLCVGDGAIRYHDEILDGYRCEFGSSAHPSAAPLVQLAHARALREEWVSPARSSRSTCACPMPRSTGPRGGRGDERAPMSVLARLLQRADDDEPIVIEEMRRKHLADMLPIEHDAYPKPWSRAVFESELEQVRSGSRYYIVARRRRVVIGYAGLWISPDPAGAQGHITNIVVAADHRRRGVAIAPARVARGGGDRARLRRVDVGGQGVEHRCPGAVPQVRVRSRRGAQAVLREHRGRDRDVVPRHPDRGVRATAARVGRRDVSPDMTVT